MNLIRKFLLKLAKGVAQEEAEAIPQKTIHIVKQEYPLITLRAQRMIESKYPQYSPLEAVVKYTEREMAWELVDKMQENGMIRYTHSHEKDIHLIEAEIRAVKWDG